jgi:hypothetical protein
VEGYAAVLLLIAVFGTWSAVGGAARNGAWLAKPSATV